MLTILNDKITDFMIEHNLLKEEKGVPFSAHLYGILLSLLIIMISVPIGFMLGHVTYSLTVAAAFLGLRTVTGGYHFEHIYFEILVYGAAIFTATFLAIHIPINYPLILVYFNSSILMSAIVPIEDPERDFSTEKAVKYRHICMFLFLVYLAAACYLTWFSLRPYACCVLYGAFMAYLFVIPGFVIFMIKYDMPQGWEYLE